MSYRTSVIATSAVVLAILCFIARRVGTVEAQSASNGASPLCLLPPAGGPPWLPITPEPQETQSPAPRSESDCGFYRPAWQRFLVATQPAMPSGSPAFLGYPSFEDVFSTVSPSVNKLSKNQTPRLTLTARNIQRPNDPPPKVQQLLSQTQAGIGGAPGGSLIDQRGHFVYYAINVNPAFVDFLRKNNLTTLAGLQNMDPKLTFPPGVVELKSAWMIVKDKQSAPTYFVVPARVQRYVVLNGSLVPQVDSKTHQPVFMDVQAALLAIHVVFTLPGHPEMIWSTFEHVHLDNKDNPVRDNAPAALGNPSNTSSDTVISTSDFPLYKAGTKAGDANHPVDMATMVQHWDSNTQSFNKGGSLVQTSVYRPYPGSKSDGSKAGDSDEDDEVILINNNATKMFRDAKAAGKMNDSDMRQNYRLVGAIWLDSPLLGTNPSFRVGRTFSNPTNQATDDPASELAGEGRLGSTAMESFTEFEDGAPQCFSCHDTKAVRGSHGILLPQALLNVSHVMSKFKDSQPTSTK